MSEEETKSVKPSKSKRSSRTVPEEEPENTGPPPQEDEGGWKKFVWNEDTREFLGRTGKSWLLIFIFYVIFFISLFAFFMFNWYLVLTLTVTDKHPSKTGDKIGSVLFRDGPGLGVRPLTDRTSNAGSSLVWFAVGGYESIRFWKNQLNSWFYNIPNSGAPDTKVCTPTSIADDKSCEISWDDFGPCSPVDPTKNTLSDFGYMRGEPCVLVKVNRVSHLIYSLALFLGHHFH